MLLLSTMPSEHQVSNLNAPCSPMLQASMQASCSSIASQVDALAALVKRHIDLDILLQAGPSCQQIAPVASSLSSVALQVQQQQQAEQQPLVAVAVDEAFRPSFSG